MPKVVAHESVGQVRVIRPLEDSQWAKFVQWHPRSSVFHTTGWLEALQRTYGYTPLALTTSPPDKPLDNGWLFCSIRSWLTGRRWVSLPFSDHCEPLIDERASLDQFFATFETLLGQERLRYIEARPLETLVQNSSYSALSLFCSPSSYCFHTIDLRPDIQTLFQNCHKGSTQRKIRRAERERLDYKEGRTAALIDAFYQLQLLTRRRHGLPPQPKQWFRNLAECLGDAAQFRVAYKGSQPVAAILTIRHKQTMVYKYGCSDTAYNNLGGMHLLLWKSIEDAKRSGLQTFDFGRSDLAGEGLITFKDRWGSQRSVLRYSRFTSTTAPKDAHIDSSRSRDRLISKVFAHTPDVVARAIGQWFYRHVG